MHFKNQFLRHVLEEAGGSKRVRELQAKGENTTFIFYLEPDGHWYHLTRQGRYINFPRKTMAQDFIIALQNYIQRQAEKRLAELEALELVVNRFVLPRAKHAYIDAQRERVWKSPSLLKTPELRKLMYGHALWDDPPEGWTTEQLANWSRGYLSGREAVGLNLSQHFYFLIQALDSPADFWKRQQLGFLELCAGSPCSCGGFYEVEEEKCILVCKKCWESYTYDQLVEIQKMNK